MITKKPLSLDAKLKFTVPPIDEEVVDYFLRSQLTPISRRWIQGCYDFASNDQVNLFMLTARLDSFWLWEANKVYPEKFKEHIWALYEVEKIEKYICGDELN